MLMNQRAGAQRCRVQPACAGRGVAAQCRMLVEFHSSECHKVICVC